MTRSISCTRSGVPFLIAVKPKFPGPSMLAGLPPSCAKGRRMRHLIVGTVLTHNVYPFQELPRIAIFVPPIRSLLSARFGLTSGETYPASTRLRLYARAARYSSVSMSFVHLPLESTRQLLGARK